MKKCVSLYLKTPGIRTRIQRPQNLSWILHNPLEVFQNQSLAFCFAILLLHACSDRSLSLTRYLGNILLSIYLLESFLQSCNESKLLLSGFGMFG